MAQLGDLFDICGSLEEPGPEVARRAALAVGEWAYRTGNRSAVSAIMAALGLTWGGSGAMPDVVTPAVVEKQMQELIASNREAYQDLRHAEDEYEALLGAYETQRAAAYLATHRLPDQKGWTEERRKAHAVNETATLRVQLGAASARVRAARAKVSAIRTEADLVRSIGTSVRVALETA